MTLHWSASQTDSTTGVQLQASRTYPEASVEEYPAEGGMLVICHGGISVSKPGPAPARLQPFCEAWNSYVASRGEHTSASMHLAGLWQSSEKQL